MKTPSPHPKSPRNDLSNVGDVKKLIKMPKPQKGPVNVLKDLAGVTNLASTPEPIIFARAAVTVDKTPEEPPKNINQIPSKAVTFDDTRNQRGSPTIDKGSFEKSNTCLNVETGVKDRANHTE